MFDIGWSELLVVGLVALIVVGPKELPGMMKKIGQMIRKAKSTASSFQRQFEDAMDEGELGDLKASVKGLKDELDPNKIMGDIDGVDDIDDFDLDKWNEQILEDEKKRNDNPIRSEEEMKATIGEADTIGAKTVTETTDAANEDAVLVDKNKSEPLAQEKQVS